MSVFTEAELRYLSGGRQLGRIATVGADGTPHVVPVGWIFNAARDTIDVGGYELEQSKKFRDVARSGRAAIVIDDLESTDPWGRILWACAGRSTSSVCDRATATPSPTSQRRRPRAGGSDACGRPKAATRSAITLATARRGSPGAKACLWRRARRAAVLLARLPFVAATRRIESMNRSRPQPGL